MNRPFRLVFGVCVVVLLLVAPVIAASAAPATTCTARLTIFTTSPGDVSNTGQVTHYRGSGVAGMYTSGFLAGYTFTGSQDIQMNNNTHRSTLSGEYLATGPGGTFTVHYTGSADLNTGAATGGFVVMDGTGDFAGFHWAGDIQAQLVSLTPPTFLSMDTGMCNKAP